MLFTVKDNLLEKAQVNLATLIGIQRVSIESEWNDHRTELAKSYIGELDILYRSIFTNIGCPLADGSGVIYCTKDEVKGRYDWQEGIDIILTFYDGTRSTLQEKVLTFNVSTATFEEIKNSGELGAWYYCTSQYYSIFYVNEVNRTIRDWILIDLPQLHRQDMIGNVIWHGNKNKKDGRRSRFRYIYFDEIPQLAVVSRKITNILTIIKPVKEVKVEPPSDKKTGQFYLF
jgi:hypothetical protein